MQHSAITAMLKLQALTSTPCSNLRATTKASPKKPNNKPNHWRRDTWPPREDNQMAVSTGCKPTIKADKPEPMPALTAAHTPPK
jgi:hypothetical protein